ncbi:MAG: T9SS type A sorting domain-containing protein [Ignavibacteria bacterium]|nr:T9SS type A sorting domain-containing protein [Ignavibacteria bacterium]
MKTLFISLGISLMILTLAGFDKFNSGTDSRTFSFKTIDANQIKTVITNTGFSDRNPGPNTSAFEWPKNSGKYAIYYTGLWISGKTGDSIRGSRAMYGSEYKPGYFDYALQQPMGENDPEYRLYKVSPDHPNGFNDFDPWSDWPVQQGAPWVDNNGNGIYEPPVDAPVMKGDQNFFCSFTDGYRDSILNSRSAPPLKAEIKMYAWAREQQACADAINYEWKIINKNVSVWNEFSSAIWSDLDIGTSNNDRGGTDSVKNLAFAYNGIDNDPIYGPAPPAVGIIIKDASGHSQYKSDFGNVFKCGTGGCPTDSLQTFRVMQGLNTDGNRFVNPVTGNFTNYRYSGDPVSGAGWNDSTSGDRYVLLGSKFGNVNPFDTIEFKTITYIKRGSSNLNSLTELKNCADQVIPVSNINTETPAGFTLYQNYPNPFNPSTIINYELRITNDVKLKVYDILGNEVLTLVNEKQAAGSYEAEFDGSGLASGIYFYRLETGEFIQTKRMALVK